MGQPVQWMTQRGTMKQGKQQIENKGSDQLMVIHNPERSNTLQNA